MSGSPAVPRTAPSATAHAGVEGAAAVLAELPSGIHGELALARATLDRSGLVRTDKATLARLWADAATRVLVVASGQALVEDGEEGPELVLHSPQDAPEGERVFLGQDPEDVGYFAVRAPQLPLRVGGAAREAGLREVGSLLGARDAGLLVHAVAMLNWHATHTHCPRCGTPTVIAAGGHLRRCPADGSEHHPRTDPAVIMAVIDSEDRLLLGHQAAWPTGRFSTLAGFVEPGESLEMTVVREVAEESGIHVEAVRYAGSQPWPFPSSLMLGFYARASSVSIDVDGEEIAEARWFTRTELHRAVEAGEVLLPPGVSIARRLIEGWYGAEVPEARGW